jgi:hypothetical protein
MCPRASRGSLATAITVSVIALWAATCVPDDGGVSQEVIPGNLELSTAPEHVVGAPILVKVRYSRDTEHAPVFFPDLDLFHDLTNVRGLACLLESEDGTWFKFGGVGRQHEPGFPSPRMHDLDVGGQIERTFNLRQLHIVDHHGIALWEDAMRLPGEWTLTCSVYDLDRSSGVSSPPVKMRFVEGTVTDQEVLHIVRESSRYGWFPYVFLSDLDPRTLDTVTADSTSLRAVQDVVLLTLWAMESPSSCVERYERWMKEGRDLGTAAGTCKAIAQACYLEVDKRSNNLQSADEGTLAPAVDLDRLRKTRAGLQAFRSPS